MQKIELPTIAEILDEEFMQPYGISAYRLAKDISVPVSRIQDILHGRRKISVDTALRLSKYFGLSESYFLDLQNEIELRKSKNRQKAALENIKPITQISAQLGFGEICNSRARILEFPSFYQLLLNPARQALLAKATLPLKHYHFIISPTFSNFFKSFSFLFFILRTKFAHFDNCSSIVKNIFKDFLMLNLNLNLQANLTKHF